MSGPYAFPRALPEVEVPLDDVLRVIDDHAGMSLRDYFAAKAMQAGLTGATLPGLLEREPEAVAALEAAATAFYVIADAMLKARQA